MKIGFDIQAIVGKDPRSREYRLSELIQEKELKKNIQKMVIEKEVLTIFHTLQEQNHEIYVFGPVAVMPEEKVRAKIKKCVVRKLHKAGYGSVKTAVVRAEELPEVAQRNYIDIFVVSDAGMADKISKVTDTICFSNDTSFDVLSGELMKTIEQNREPFMDGSVQPQDLPSKDRLWLKYYRVGDFKWSKDNMSPYDRLYVSNKDWMDETIMEFYGNKISYHDFFGEVNALSKSMTRCGIRKGMRVPLLVANTPEAVMVLYALYQVKATIVPIFPMSTVEDMSYKLQMISEKNQADGFSNGYLFVSDLVIGRFAEIIPIDYEVVVLPTTNSMPRAMAFAFRKLVMPKMGIKPVVYDEHHIAFSQYKNQSIGTDGESIEQIDTAFDNGYTAVQLYTGGTIKPKAVMLSEGNIDAASKQFFNDRFAFRRGDKIAAFMPLNHSFGLIIGTHVAASLGVDLDMITKIDFKRLDKLFLKDKVNLFGGIPNMFPAIRNNQYLQNADLSHVKYILSGGASIDETEKSDTTAFFKAHHSDAEVHDGYGATESAGGIIYDGIPNIDTCVKIVEPGTIRELGYEQIGELCMTGPQIMRGYMEEELTGNVLKQHEDGRTWLHTGDSAVVHTNGKVEVVGRLDRMIKVNGEQVYLDKLEEEINTLPFVEKSVVVKRVDAKRGYVPVAFIQLKPSYVWNAELENKVNAFYKGKLTAFARPRATEVLEEFPVTNVGKIDFKMLEKKAAGM